MQESIVDINRMETFHLTHLKFYMSLERWTLESLPDPLLAKIWRYLSLYDRYHSFFPLNRRFSRLIRQMTPEKIDSQRLDQEIDRSAILISDYWVWNDRFSYWIVPQLQPDSSNPVKWSFLSSHPIERSIELLDPRIIRIVKKYEVQSNAPELLVSQANYYFCSIPADLPRLERWIRENYPEQYDIIQNYGVRRHLPRRIDHYDGKYQEIKQALQDVQRLERLKRRRMIHDYAQQLWTALIDSDYLLHNHF